MSYTLRPSDPGALNIDLMREHRLRNIKQRRLVFVLVVLRLLDITTSPQNKISFPRGVTKIELPSNLVANAQESRVKLIVVQWG